jgi:hypothetical protein
VSERYTESVDAVRGLGRHGERARLAAHALLEQTHINMTAELEAELDAAALQLDQAVQVTDDLIGQVDREFDLKEQVDDVEEKVRTNMSDSTVALSALGTSLLLLSPVLVTLSFLCLPESRDAMDPGAPTRWCCCCRGSKTSPRDVVFARLTFLNSCLVLLVFLSLLSIAAVGFVVSSVSADICVRPYDFIRSAALDGGPDSDGVVAFYIACDNPDGGSVNQNLDTAAAKLSPALDVSARVIEAVHEQGGDDEVLATNFYESLTAALSSVTRVRELVGCVGVHELFEDALAVLCGDFVPQAAWLATACVVLFLSTVTLSLVVAAPLLPSSTAAYTRISR